MVLYTVSPTAKAIMAKADPEQLKASRDAWIAWREEASQTTQMESSAPLQPVGCITSEGVTDADSSLSGYSIVECESKDVLTAILQSHPYMMYADSSIDVFEMLPMPGV